MRPSVREDVGELFEDVIDEAEGARDRIRWRLKQRRDRTRRRRAADSEREENVEAELRRDEAAEAEAGQAQRERPEFPEVLGWQPLVLNRDQDCADCQTPLGRGVRAFVGLTETGLSRTTLCRDCMDARSR